MVNKSQTQLLRMFDDLLGCPYCGNPIPPRLGCCCDVKCRVALHRWRKGPTLYSLTRPDLTKGMDDALDAQQALIQRRPLMAHRKPRRNMKALHSANEHGIERHAARQMQKPKTNFCPECKSYVQQGHEHPKKNLARMSQRESTSKLRRDAVKSQRSQVLRHERFTDQQIAPIAAQWVDETIKGWVTKKKDSTLHRASSTGV